MSKEAMKLPLEAHTEVDDASIAIQEMQATEEAIAQMQISSTFQMELDRVRLDLAVSPFVNLTEDMCKWVLLANSRATPSAKYPVARVINKSIVWRPCDIAGLPVGAPLYTSPQPAQQVTEAQVEAALKAYAQQTPICWLKRHKTQDLKEVIFDKSEADAWVAQFQPGFAWLEELRTFPTAPVHPDSSRIDWLTNNPVDALDIFGHVKGADAVRWIRDEIDNAIAIKENT